MKLEWLLFAGFAVGFVAALVYLFICLSRLKQQCEGVADKLSAALNDTQKELQSFHFALEEAGSRAILLGKQHTRFSEQLKRLEQQVADIQQQDPVVRLYHRATELAKQGATVEDIVQGCDISYAEAVLLINLHQKHLDV